MADKYRKIGTALDRTFREDYDYNLDQMEKSYDETKDIAESAVLAASSVQQQFNQVVIDGDSSVEAAQARVSETSSGTVVYDTLKERLDSRENEIDVLSDEVKDIAFKPENYRLPSDTDYSSAFSKINEEIGANGRGSIILAQGKVYAGDITITSSNVSVIGKGELKGTIKIQGYQWADNGDRFLNGTNTITIRDITINGEDSRNGITLQYVVGVSIENVVFRDLVKAVSINPVDIKQHVSRVEINGNRFINCHYGYYINSTGLTEQYICGDVKFNNNVDESRYKGAEFTSRTNTIFAIGQDGLIAIGNVCFGGSGTDINMHIEKSIWVVIQANNLFTPSMNYVYLKDSQNITLNGNNCAWAIGDGFLLDNCTAYTINSNNLSWYNKSGEAYTNNGITIQNNQNGYGSISNNTIIFPYKNGIRLVNSGKNNVTGNTIRGLNSVDEAIYANGDYNHLGGNSCTGFTKKNIVSGFNSIETIGYYGEKTTYSNATNKKRKITYSNGETTINLNDVELVIFNNSAPTLINAITIDDLTTVKEIEFFSYNSNTSILRSIASLLTLAGGGQINFGTNGSMKFTVNGNKLLETNRNGVTTS